MRHASQKRTFHVGVLDWDGTLHGRDTMPAFLAYLEEEQVIRSGAVDRFSAIDRDHAEGNIDRREMTLAHTQLFADALTGMHRDHLEAHARAFVAAGDAEHIFPFTSAFIRSMQAMRVEPILISGAPKVVLAVHAAALGIHPRHVHALEVHYDEHGYVTNLPPVPTADAATKESIVQDYRHNGGKAIVGFGNSASDLPLLLAAEIPIYIGDTVPAGAPDTTALISESGVGIEHVLRRVRLAVRPTVSRGLEAVRARLLGK